MEILLIKNKIRKKNVFIHSHLVRTLESKTQLFIHLFYLIVMCCVNNGMLVFYLLNVCTFQIIQYKFPKQISMFERFLKNNIKFLIEIVSTQRLRNEFEHHKLN